MIHNNKPATPSSASEAPAAIARKGSAIVKWLIPRPLIDTPLYLHPALHQPPSGEWVMVPREPTEAMIEASMIRIPIAKRIPAGATFKVLGARAWAAMIAAAPPADG